MVQLMYILIDICTLLHTYIFIIYVIIYMYVYVYIYQLNRHHGKYDHVFHAFFWGGDCDVS